MTTTAAPYSNETEFNDAVAKCLEAADAYYNSSEILMLDADYDALIERITASIMVHPEWNAQGLLESVAAGVGAGGDVTHPVPMLSLGKSKEISDIEELVTRLTSEGYGTVTECKMDGLAVRCVYENGELVLAATRGDGKTGENVTAQAMGIVGLPAKLKKKESFEIRGEVYMTETQFEKASELRVAAGKTAFVNPRNATAGLLRNFTDAPTTNLMSFAAYDASNGLFEKIDSYTKRMQKAATMGFHTTVDLLDLDPNGNPTEIIQHIEQERATLGFPIDGAVVKVDSIAARDTIGVVSRHPKWAMAFKYSDLQVASTLRSIEITIGKTGRLAIIGNIDPVFVEGATVSKASLHNVDWLVSSGMNIGSQVAVSRANGVIPRIVPLGTSNTTPWTPPTVCPQCGGDWDKSTLLWRCTSPDCSIVGKISYAGNRDNLDWENLGEEVAVALVEQGLVNNIADVFTLTETQLANLQLGTTPSGQPRLLGATVAKKIVKSVEASKKQPLNRILSALSIRQTGRTMSRRIASHFKTLQAIRTSTVEDLTQVEGIATEKATAIYEGLKETSDIIDRLVSYGVTTEVENANQTNTATASSLPFAGLKVVVTGTVPGLTRTEAQEWAEKLGGTASSSVSKTVDLVVVGEGAGSKATKAETLGIRIMPAEEFATLVEANR